MSYSNRDSMTVTIPALAFTAASAGKFRLPKGKRGRLIEVMINATTTFTATTTEGLFKLGTAASGAEIANCGLGTTAAGTSYNATMNDGDIKGVDLPNDADIHYTIVAPTGGTPAGAGHVQIVIGIF